EDGPESIDSIIDMDAVCKRVTTLGLDVSVTISQDAGSLGSQKSKVKVVAGLVPSGGAEGKNPSLPKVTVFSAAKEGPGPSRLSVASP
ncbi:PGPEP1 isoform 3, partial [Pongo abelii]